MSKLLVAIDPGETSGVCWIAQDGAIQTFAVKQALAAGDARVLALATLINEHGASVAIERSRCRLGRFTTHRNHAAQWDQLMRTLCPRRTTRRYVDPQKWQRALGIENFGEKGDKNRSVNYCRFVLSEHIKTSHEADARCIVEWLKGQVVMEEAE